MAIRVGFSFWGTFREGVVSMGVSGSSEPWAGSRKMAPGPSRELVGIPVRAPERPIQDPHSGIPAKIEEAVRWNPRWRSRSGGR
jgi:hypothetical protein